jgi:hypothetical protein
MTGSVIKPSVPWFGAYVLVVSPAALHLTASLNMNEVRNSSLRMVVKYKR